MSEPTEPTQPTPTTPPVPPDEAPTTSPSAAGRGATPPPPPAATWSTAPPADAPTGPYPTPAPATPTIGRNLAVGIAVGALVIGGFLGALISHVVDDGGSNDRIGFSDGRSGQMGQMHGGRGQGEMPMRPRGVDPDGDDWTGGQNGRMPDGSTPSTPSTPTTTPAVAGT